MGSPAPHSGAGRKTLLKHRALGQTLTSKRAWEGVGCAYTDIHRHRQTGHGLSPGVASGKSKASFAKGETEAQQKVSSLQPAQGREESLSGATLCRTSLPQHLPCCRGSSHFLSAWPCCSEAFFFPGLLWAPLSITPGRHLPDQRTCGMVRGGLPGSPRALLQHSWLSLTM